MRTIDGISVSNVEYKLEWNSMDTHSYDTNYIADERFVEMNGKIDSNIPNDECVMVILSVSSLLQPIPIVMDSSSSSWTELMLRIVVFDVVVDAVAVLVEVFCVYNSMKTLIIDPKLNQQSTVPFISKEVGYVACYCFFCKRCAEEILFHSSFRSEFVFESETLIEIRHPVPPTRRELHPKKNKRVFWFLSVFSYR